MGFGPPRYFLVTKKPVIGVEGFRNNLPVNVAFAFSPGSDLVELFTHHTLKLRQSGMLALMYDKAFGIDKPKDMSQRIFLGTEASPLGFTNLIFPVFSLCAGLTFAFLLVVMERMKTSVVEAESTSRIELDTTKSRRSVAWSASVNQDN